MKNFIVLALCAFTFTLYSQNKIESSIEEYYNGSSWDLYYGYDYEYDNNKNLTKEVSYNWTNNVWEKDGEINCTYNANNQITEEIEIGLDMVGQLSNVEKITYTYDGTGNLSQMLSHEWDGTQWEAYNRQVFTYNSGKLSKIEFEELIGSQWYVEERYNFTYTGNVLTLLSLEEYDGSQWDATAKISFSYDSNNKRTNSVYEYFDGTNWEQFEDIDFTLDANFNRIKKSLSYQGIEEFYVDYTYDLTDQLSNYAHPFIYSIGIDTLIEDFPYVNKILSYTGNEYDEMSGTFYPSERTIFNYNNQLVLKVDDVKQIQNINLYPNPANNFIQISGITKSENVSVYTVLGVKAFDAVISENDKLNIETLTNGLYLLKFENGTALKFLKK